MGDVRQQADTAANPQVYLPVFQSPGTSPIVFLRASRDAASLAIDARRVIRELAPLSPVYDVKTMDERTAAATARARFSATLLGLFALTALSLAAVGIYGVMSLAVTSRTREIGIRMALGADRGRVQRLVVGEGALLVAVGAIAGMGGALLSTRVLRSLLFDTEPSDPVTYATMLVVLGVVALAASWLPARRAARVDPLVALRAE